MVIKVSRIFIINYKPSTDTCKNFITIRLLAHKLQIVKIMNLMQFRILSHHCFLMWNKAVQAKTVLFKTNARKVVCWLKWGRMMPNAPVVQKTLENIKNFISKKMGAAFVHSIRKAGIYQLFWEVFGSISARENGLYVLVCNNRRNLDPD